jgi:proline iminopeptidase
MPYIPIRNVSLYVKEMGSGYPLLLMHGGPGVDHSTMLPLKRLADHFRLVFYDHRCNGRSRGAETSSMTFENLTADADALRQQLGFEKWAVLGHSFGGMVALEYALRYPRNLSHLLLVDTCGESRLAQINAPQVLAARGFNPEVVELARRFFNGEIEPREMTQASMKFGRAYYHKLNAFTLAREMISGMRMKTQPEALIFGFGQLLKGWNVMDRLGEITAPTLVLAGRDDFQFPPEHQESLAKGIPNARLQIIEEAGHNVLSEKPVEVMQEITRFLASARFD